MIAKTILQQLGGRRFAAMTGSKNFIDLGNGLQMRLARNKTSANRLKVILDEATDTYTMCFYRQSMTKNFDIKVKDIARYEGVYFDMLQAIFTEVTAFTPAFDIFTGGGNRRPLLLTVSRWRLKSSKKPLFPSAITGRMPLKVALYQWNGNIPDVGLWNIRIKNEL